ncbi:MAG: beta-propeller domain-containing protein [Propionibacteriaceae bacterium]|nr:beta-propeller domain-containing protein [Propionibacteriaceae bacterium]
MSEQDEFSDQFHQMKELLTPSPDLVARLDQALRADPAGDVARPVDPAADAPRPAAAPQTTTPVTARKNTGPTRSTRPGAHRRPALALVAGGAASVVLAAAMVVGSVSTSPWGASPEYPIAPRERPVLTPVTTPVTHAVDAGDYQDVYRAVATSTQSSINYSFATRGLPVAPAAGGVVFAEDAGSQTWSPYTRTNQQVAGVSEADIAITDGSYLYIAKGRSVAVVAATGAGTRQVATIDTSGLTASGEILTGAVTDMVIDGTTLIVFLHGFTADADSWSAMSPQYISMQASTLKAAFFDISDPTHPTLDSVLSQSGTYVDSRVYDDRLYLISRYPVDTTRIQPTDPTTFVPLVDSGSGPVPVPYGDIVIMPRVDTASYVVVTATDIAQRSRTSEQAVLGAGDTVYMSTDNLYIASSQWWSTSDAPTIDIPGHGAYQGARTDIVRLSLNSGALSIDAQGTVAGTVINQFSLDESNGYLRVATTWNDDMTSWAPCAGLWVLDSSLNLVGSIPQLASNESIQSVRFTGDTAYVVTFRQVDPLFAVDVSDPKAPTVMSALKIPGFSTYLHPYSDTLLLGVGVDGDESGRTSGLKVSMYDVSDPLDVTQVAATPVAADSTEVSQDHKAAYVDTDADLVGFPTMAWSDSGSVPEGAYITTYTWNYLVFAWTGSQFTQKATLSLYSGAYEAAPTVATQGVARGMRIGDSFYLVTADTVSVYEMHTFTSIATVALTA